MPRFGSNILNCPIPIILENRYFVLEQENGQDIFSVFTLRDRTPIFEILRNEPQDNPLTTASKTAPGFITVVEKETGNLLYKLRPVYRGSSIFGRIKGKETEISITDREISVGGIMKLQGNEVRAEVGIIVRGGSVSIGGFIPEEAKHLFKEKG